MFNSEEKFILLQPIHKSLAETCDNGTLLGLCNDLQKKFGLQCQIAVPCELPDYAFNEVRRQYLAAEVVFELKKARPSQAKRVLGITDEDLYAPNLSFVFGQAELSGRVGVISTHRLHPKPSQSNGGSLYTQRVLKEAVHELGHTFGLGHCSDSTCVMHFSITLDDTDLKLADFCTTCRDSMRSYMRRNGN